MNSSRLIVSTLAMAAGVLTATLSIAQNEQHNKNAIDGVAVTANGKLLPVTEKEASWAAQARKTYPLDVCVASDEKLGAMGKSPEYIYREGGKPDRLVVFCCDGCEDDFMKDPAKYLAKIDAAAKNKGAAGKKAGGTEHKGHHE